MKARALAAAAAVVWLAALPARAQVATGTILGTVKDAQGATVPGASVTATHLDTQFSRSATSDAAGQYTLSYDLASDLSGWGGYVEPGYNLCGGGSTAGCPDVTTLRIMARAVSFFSVSFDMSSRSWQWSH